VSEPTQQFLFVIGPQRSGTTWIYSFLRNQSSGVYLDRLEKENYRFSRTSTAKAKHDRSWFLNRISGIGDVTLCADVCSTYFGHVDCIERILASFPEAKFVYIRRDETSRRKSFEGHRDFNGLSTWILGYEISWDLYNRQSKYDEFDTWMKNRLNPNQFRALEFADLKKDGGTAWISSISELTSVKFEPVQQGVVNKSRKDKGLPRRIFFVFVRLIQATRIHIFLRWLKARIRKTNLTSARKRGAA